MNPNLLSQIFSYTILFAAVVGACRYRRITPGDRPFFYMVWLALIGEILSEVFRTMFRNTAPVGNIYVLIEALLFTWLFYNWKSVRKPVQFPVVCMFICIVWILDNLVFHRLTWTNSSFRIIVSFILVFLAIDQINQLITTERGNLLKNARFLISIGVLIYFCYKAFSETFFLTTEAFSDPFQIGVLSIMDYVNLFVNLIFGLAALWIPTRQKFILPS